MKSKGLRVQSTFDFDFKSDAHEVNSFPTRSKCPTKATITCCDLKISQFVASTSGFGSWSQIPRPSLMNLHSLSKKRSRNLSSYWALYMAM